MFKRYIAGLLILVTSSVVSASDNEDKKALFESILPGVSIDSVTKLDNTNLYETVINGDVVYFSADGRYVFQGDVIEMESRENLTEAKRTDLRQSILAGLDEKDMIIYEPKKTEYTLTVFTDIDCGYCRKLHQEMKEYNDLGIRIRYMAFPRAGLDSESYDKAVNVWCSKDREQALTDAKAGLDVQAETCDAPVRSQYEIGHKLGVNGTPALFLENGQLLPGYVPPKRLKELLDDRAAS